MDLLLTLILHYKVPAKDTEKEKKGTGKGKNSKNQKKATQEEKKEEGKGKKEKEKKKENGTQKKESEIKLRRKLPLRWTFSTSRPRQCSIAVPERVYVQDQVKKLL